MIRKILTSSDTTNPLLVGTYQNEVIDFDKPEKLFEKKKQRP